MRLVFDTAVMVAAIRSDRGASRWLLRAALEQSHDFSLLVSVPLLIEYEAVMTRPEHLRVARLSTADVASLLDGVVGIAEPVTLNFLWRPVLPDGDDDMVLEAAVNGRADGIVTFNRRDFGPATDQFGIALWALGDLVRRLETKS